MTRQQRPKLLLEEHKMWIVKMGTLLNSSNIYTQFASEAMMEGTGLSFRPYKQVVSMRSLNNYSNNKLHYPHGFKEEINIKFDAIKAVVKKFPNGTGAMM